MSDALTKKGASVVLAANDWVKMDQIAWAVQAGHLCHQHTCCTGCTTRSASAHPEDSLLAAHIRKRERTILKNACLLALTGPCRQRVSLPCENSTPARGALDWLRNTTCSGPPSSHPSVPVRVGHQMLHESHRFRFHRGVYWCTTCGQLAQHAGKKSKSYRVGR